jgi:hypothetical protein
VQYAHYSEFVKEDDAQNDKDNNDKDNNDKDDV